MATKFSFNGLIQSISKLIADEDGAHVNGTRKLTPQQVSHQHEIESSILVLAAEVIRCDKNYTTDTEQYILSFVMKHFGGTATAKRIKKIAEHVDGGTEPFTKIACKELKLLTTYDSRVSIVGFLFGVANADDYINAKEARCVQRIAGYLGVTDADFKPLKMQFTQNNNPYSMLGLNETATKDEVKKAYRKLILKHHPDKRDKSVTEAEASEKFRTLQKAFNVIMENQDGN